MEWVPSFVLSCYYVLYNEKKSHNKYLRFLWWKEAMQRWGLVLTVSEKWGLQPGPLSEAGCFPLGCLGFVLIFCSRSVSLAPASMTQAVMQIETAPLGRWQIVSNNFIDFFSVMWSIFGRSGRSFKKFHFQYCRYGTCARDNRDTKRTRCRSHRDCRFGQVSQ